MRDGQAIKSMGTALYALDYKIKLKEEKDTSALAVACLRHRVSSRARVSDQICECTGILNAWQPG